MTKTFKYRRRIPQQLKTLNECEFSKQTGHTFAGWKVEGDDTIYTETANYSFMRATNVNAQWSHTPYQVTKDSIECDITCAATGKYLEALDISWEKLSTTGKTYNFSSITIQGGLDSTSPILYQNVQDIGHVKFVMYTDYYPQVKVTVMYTSNSAIYDVVLNLNDGEITSSADFSTYTYGIGLTLPTSEQITRAGYMFQGWYDNEALTGDPVYSIGVTDTDEKQFWAKWVLAKSLTLQVSPANAGKVTGAGTYPAGTEVTVTATPKTHYKFKNWSDGGEQTHNVALTEDINLTATFQSAYSTTYKLWLNPTVNEGLQTTYTTSATKLHIKIVKTEHESGYITVGDAGYGPGVVEDDIYVMAGTKITIMSTGSAGSASCAFIYEYDKV